MFSPEERQRAVDLYFTTPMTTDQVMKHLGYPTRQCLERWLTKDPQYAGHMAKPIIPLETRTKAIELVLGGMQQKRAAEWIGYNCLCSISCCGFSHDDFSGLGRACRPRNGLNWMVLVSPPERTGKDYDQHAPSTVYPSFAAERGIRRVDRAENTCQRADGA